VALPPAAEGRYLPVGGIQAYETEAQHTVDLRTITVDKNPDYPKAIPEMKEDAELWRFCQLRQVKFWHVAAVIG
jgi:hypothetical protein